MKNTLKNLASEIRELKRDIKVGQRKGKFFGQYNLELLQANYRFRHLLYTLSKKKVELEDVSIQKILDLGIEKEPVNPNKYYRNPHIDQIKREMHKLREEQEDENGL